MVKSKKMSKSSIAVIVLAILLVLSMVLGLTGAWFTFTKTADAGTTGTLTFRDDAMSVTVATSANTVIKRDLNGDGDVADEGEKVFDAATDFSDLMPGDQITGASITIKFTVADTNKAYYVIKVGSKFYSTQGSEEVTATTVPTVVTTPASGEGSEGIVFNATTVTVPGSTTTNESQGTTYDTSSVNLGAIEIRMIQYENITMADAFTSLTTTGAFPDNKAEA